MSTRAIWIGALIVGAVILFRSIMRKRHEHANRVRPRIARPRRVPHKVYADPKGNIHHEYKNGMYLGKAKTDARRWQYLQLDGSIMPHFSESMLEPEIVS